MKRSLLAAVTLLLAPPPAQAEDRIGDRIACGTCLAQIMDCAACHRPRGPDGAPIHDAGLSGGNVGFEIPGPGIFWLPSLTPTGSALGGRCADEIAAAIRTGVRPEGRALAPAMPWPNCACPNAEHAADLAPARAPPHPSTA